MPLVIKWVLLLVTLLVVAIIPKTSVSAFDFNWDINDMGIDINFDDENEDSEIIFLYNISAGKRAVFDILDYDTCAISSNNIGAITGNAIVGTEIESFNGNNVTDYTINVDIKQNLIESSSYWNEQNNGKDATIQFCVRVDLTLDDGPPTYTSVNFYEKKVKLDIDMTAGFNVVGINGERTNATITKKNATVNYDVLAYQCLELGGDSVPILLRQGSTCGVCIKLNDTSTQSSGVYVGSILSLDFVQEGSIPGINDFTYNAIINPSISTGLSSQSCTGGQCYTQTQIISEFFNKPNPKPINIVGKCLLGFGNARRLGETARSTTTEDNRSLLFGSTSDSKKDDDDDDDEKTPFFQMQVFLDNTDYYTPTDGYDDDMASDISSGITKTNVIVPGRKRKRRGTTTSIGSIIASMFIILFTVSGIGSIIILIQRYNERKEEIMLHLLDSDEREEEQDEDEEEESVIYD